MPEFAEVNVQVRYLQERCRGWKIQDFGFEGWSHFQNLEEDGRDAVLRDFFVGNELEDATQKGKHVILRTRNGLMLSHLMFKGRWSVASEPFLSNYKHHKKPPTDKSNNFWMIAEGGERLNFHEPEYKGKITVHPGIHDPSQIEGLSKLGPDALILPQTDPAFNQNPWTLDYFADKTGRSKQAIKAFLLDQKKQAGLGNMYVCESLYTAKIAPTRAANSLSSQEVEDLHSAAQNILRQAIETDLDYPTLLRIYKKKEDAQGNEVLNDKVGGRDTYWVPNVQK